MKNLRITDKIKIAFAAAIVFTGFVLGAMYANMRRTATESANVRSTLSVLMHLENVLIKVQAMETGQRAYTVSGDSSFLKSYEQAINTIGADFDILSHEPSNGVIDTSEVDELVNLANQKIAYSKLLVERRRVLGFDSAAAEAQELKGKKMMNDFISHLNKVEEKERNFLQQSNLERQNYANRLTLLFFILAVLFSASILGGYVFIMQDFKRAEKLNRTLLYNTTLLRTISDPIITTDEHYRISDWNQYAADLFGYKYDEVKGRPVRELLNPDIQGSNRDDAEKTLLEKGTWKGEVLYFTKTGNTIVAEVSVSLVRDEHNLPTGTVSVIRNITDRVTLQNDLEKLTASLQEKVNRKVNELNLIFERIADAFIALDNDWNYTYLNKAALTLHDRDEKELIGKNIWELYPDVVREPFYDALHLARRTQQPQRLELYFSKEDRWYEDLIYPGPEGISVYYRDITERKNAEQQLQAADEALKFSNERFELVAKATNDAIWDWDIETDELRGNESFCKLFEIPDGSSIHYDDFINRVHPDDRERIRNNFTGALKKKEALLTEEFRFKDSSGKYKVVYDRAYILYNDAHKGYRMLGAMQDITHLKETENNLLLQKELSDKIINTLPGIFYLYNRSGNFYLWNRNFETVSGYSAGEIRTMTPLDFFVEAEKALLQEKIKSVFNTGSDYVEANFLTKSGKTIPYYFTGRLINYEGEDCLMGVGLDITEKVRSQEELVESEEKFRTLVQQASDGIIITNEDAQFIDVNESFAALTGYTREELLDMTAYQVFDNIEVLSRPFKYNEMTRGMVVLIERVIKKKNGRTVNVEVSAKQLPDGLFQGIIRDITERKVVEEALRVSEKKYRLLFNENPLPMWILSIPGKKFLDVNTAAINSYGWTKEEFLRMHFSNLNPLDPDPVPENIKQGTIRHKGIWGHRKKNGDVIKVNIISHNIVYEGGPAILVLANDITDKFIAEENLQRSHEALRELASHLESIRENERTHMAREIHDELGQQLTGLKMDISWLGKRINSDDEEVKEKLKDTIQLIDKTVITVRRIATQLRPSILDDLGLVAAMEWQSDEFEKRSEIKSSFTSNVTHILLSPDIATAIFRIFQESLTNVLRHSQATEVTSSLLLENDIIILTIEDNGIGFREDEILNKKTLGLLGMKERVMLINGTYEIHGNTGHGTSVIITVPLK